MTVIKLDFEASSLHRPIFLEKFYFLGKGRNVLL